MSDNAAKAIAKAIMFLGLCIVRAAVAASFARSSSGAENAQHALNNTVQEYNQF